jgi:hypothetical protein
MRRRQTWSPRQNRRDAGAGCRGVQLQVLAARVDDVMARTSGYDEGDVGLDLGSLTVDQDLTRFEQTEQCSALCSGSRGGCRQYRFRSFESSSCFAGAGHDGRLHSEAPAQCRCSHHPKPRRYSEAVARRRGCVMTVLAMLELRAGSSHLCSNDSVKFEEEYQSARSALQRNRTWGRLGFLSKD